jgi:formylglycine-generating enzyme required for sulfatase activity
VRIFLSYSSKDRALAEPIYFTLRADRHRVFFDRSDLPPGEEYDTRIRQSIEAADLFIFLVSPNSIDEGSYTLAELDIARKTWESPGGRVLPVLIRPTELERVPAYLRAVTILEPDGNVPAIVGDAVNRIALRRRRAARAYAGAGLAAALALAAGAYFILLRPTITAPGRQAGAVAPAAPAARDASGPPAREISGKDGAPALLVPAGTFVMGDGENAVRHEVSLDGFYMDKYEVTASRYAKFLEATGQTRRPEDWETLNLASRGDRPVIGVNWHEADSYCRWAGRRLPTEAEWEKAARGTDERTYPWGKQEPSTSLANFGKAQTSAYRDGLAPVGSHEAGHSPYGIDDLAGNVSEWVADWYVENLPTDVAWNPTGPASGQGKVIRGGGWYDPPQRLQSAKRFYASPENRADDIGFRCAQDVSKDSTARGDQRRS